MGKIDINEYHARCPDLGVDTDDNFAFLMNNKLMGEIS